MGAAAGVGVVSMVGVTLKAATPVLMSRLGVVVLGVGTIFKAGGAVSTVQSLSEAAFTLPVLGKAAAIGGVVAFKRGLKGL